MLQELLLAGDSSKVPAFVLLAVSVGLDLGDGDVFRFLQGAEVKVLRIPLQTTPPLGLKEEDPD